MASTYGAIVSQWIFYAIAVVFVLLRMYVRIFLQGLISLSDGFVILAALLMAYGRSGNTIALAWDIPEVSSSISPNGILKVNSTGNGPAPSVQTHPIPHNLLHKATVSYELLYIGTVIFYSAMWCVKIAFIIFYYKLFPDDVKWLRFSLHITAIYVAVAYILTMFLNLFECDPVSRNWDVARPDNVCLSYNLPLSYWMSAALHLSTEVCLFLLPFFVLRELNLSRGTKTSVTIMFTIGALIIAIGAARVIIFAVGSDTPSILIWRGVEQSLALLVVCLPYMKWLYVALVLHGHTRGEEIDRMQMISEEDLHEGAEAFTLRVRRFRRDREDSFGSWGDWQNQNQNRDPEVTNGQGMHVDSASSSRRDSAAHPRNRMSRLSRLSVSLARRLTGNSTTDDLERSFTHDTLGTQGPTNPSGQAVYREPARKSSEALVPSPYRGSKGAGDSSGAGVRGSSTLAPGGWGSNVSRGSSSHTPEDGIKEERAEAVAEKTGTPVPLDISVKQDEIQGEKIDADGKALHSSETNVTERSENTGETDEITARHEEERRPTDTTSEPSAGEALAIERIPTREVVGEEVIDKIYDIEKE